MGIGLEVEQTETALPLELTVEKLGVGGVPGLFPTVAVRNAFTTNSYLDFFDNTFKIAGWTTKYASMTDIERGHYQRLLDVSALALPLGFRLAAEYHVDNGVDIKGDDLDLFLVTDKLEAVDLVRKYHTNRLEETSGTPGKLRLYDDDAVTLIKTHDIKDESGGGVVGSPGSPARRSTGVP